MKIFRRIGALLGFLKDEHHGGAAAAGGEVVEEEDHGAAGGGGDDDTTPPRRAKRGFSVQVPVNVERPLGPIVVPCNPGDGGIQGFRWYGRRLRMDEDGDVADEFLGEVTPSGCPNFEVKSIGTRPAPVRKQAMVVDGSILQGMEYQGRLTWV